MYKERKGGWKKSRGFPKEDLCIVKNSSLTSRRRRSRRWLPSRDSSRRIETKKKIDISRRPFGPRWRKSAKRANRSLDPRLQSLRKQLSNLSAKSSNFLGLFEFELVTRENVAISTHRLALERVSKRRRIHFRHFRLDTESNSREFSSRICSP